MFLRTAYESMLYTTFRKQRIKFTWSFQPTYVKKTLYKKEHAFMIKSLKKVGIDITHLNIIKAIYGIRTANIILNGKKLKVFTQRSGTRQECSLFSLLFDTILEVLATAIRQRKINKRCPNWKGRSNETMYRKLHQRLHQKNYQNK